MIVALNKCILPPADSHASSEPINVLGKASYRCHAITYLQPHHHWILVLGLRNATYMIKEHISMKESDRKRCRLLLLGVGQQIHCYHILER